MHSLIGKIRAFFRLIKFEHTIFALPFAYMGAVLAQKGVPSAEKWLWITLAMAGARTAAMALNRIFDLKYDAENPRTRNRPLVTGEISKKATWVAALFSLGVLFYSAFQLNLLCLILSPLAVGLLFFYSFTKRFTSLSHLFLGLVQACAPIGGWLAITERFEGGAFLLGAAVVFWLAGFDIIYATLDVEFDKTHGLHSIPSALGMGRALWLSSFFHILTFAFFVALGLLLECKTWYWLGCGFTGALLIYEHDLVKPRDLSRVNEAFFTVNGWISVCLFLFTLLETVKF